MPFGWKLSKHLQPFAAQILLDGLHSTLREAGISSREGGTADAPPPLGGVEEDVAPSRWQSIARGQGRSVAGSSLIQPTLCASGSPGEAQQATPRKGQFAAKRSLLTGSQRKLAGGEGSSLLHYSQEELSAIEQQIQAVSNQRRQAQTARSTRPASLWSHKHRS